MNTLATQVSCPVCKSGIIVAEFGVKEIEFTSSTMIGPLRDRPKVEVKNFHCSSCLVLFLYPPGMPNAEQARRYASFLGFPEK